MRDVDVNGEGRILFSDILLITSRYKNVSTDSTYALTYDIDNDGELDVSDLSRIGLQYNAR